MTGTHPEPLFRLPRLIALAGYGGAGKDDLAGPLIDAGYVRLNFGDVIKDFFGPFLRGEMGLLSLRYCVMQRMAEGITADDVNQFLIYECATFLDASRQSGLRSVDPFTEDRDVKALLRPILERGGELIYDYVFKAYFYRLHTLISEGKRVVNTRLCKVPEAQAWRELGGKLWVVKRENHPPATPWDAQVLEALHDGGWVDMVLHNAQPSGEAWREHALKTLHILNCPPLVVPRAPEPEPEYALRRLVRVPLSMLNDDSWRQLRMAREGEGEDPRQPPNESTWRALRMAREGEGEDPTQAQQKPPAPPFLGGYKAYEAEVHTTWESFLASLPTAPPPLAGQPAPEPESAPEPEPEPLRRSASASDLVYEAIWGLLGARKGKDPAQAPEPHAPPPPEYLAAMTHGEVKALATRLDKSRLEPDTAPCPPPEHIEVVERAEFSALQARVALLERRPFPSPFLDGLREFTPTKPRFDLTITCGPTD